MNDSESRRAVERILEDESLTADLVDEAATMLLEWAAKRAEAVAEQTTIPSTVRDDHLALIRWAMRHVNRVVGQRVPDEQAAGVRALLGQIEAEESPEDNSGA